nr:hypothetical protein CFP56_02616 [Quercus suber]
MILDNGRVGRPGIDNAVGESESDGGPWPQYNSMYRSCGCINEDSCLMRQAEHTSCRVQTCRCAHHVVGSAHHRRTQESGFKTGCVWSRSGDRVLYPTNSSASTYYVTVPFTCLPKSERAWKNTTQHNKRSAIIPKVVPLPSWLAFFWSGMRDSFEHTANRCSVHSICRMSSSVHIEQAHLHRLSDTQHSRTQDVTHSKLLERAGNADASTMTDAQFRRTCMVRISDHWKDVMLFRGCTDRILAEIMTYVSVL